MVYEHLSGSSVPTKRQGQGQWGVLCVVGRWTPSGLSTHFV